MAIYRVRIGSIHGGTLDTFLVQAKSAAVAALKTEARARKLYKDETESTEAVSVELVGALDIK